MATTVHESPKIQARRPRGSENGGWRNLVPAGGDPHAIQEYSPPAASTGIWVVVYAITMTFAALTSALVVRKGSSLDWQSFTLPSVLYLNTALLLASSFTLEVARRRVATFMGGLAIPGESFSRWLYVTLVFGLLSLSSASTWPGSGSAPKGSILRPTPVVPFSTCSRPPMCCTCWEVWAGCFM